MANPGDSNPLVFSVFVSNAKLLLVQLLAEFENEPHGLKIGEKGTMYPWILEV